MGVQTADVDRRPDQNRPIERNCDIVMKGGITSGVVYPLAAVSLSRRYRFKNVGGTSAGAIAAAAVAAAEHGRRSGERDPFEELATLPAWLGENLTGVFQADGPTRPLLGLVLAATASGSGFRKSLGLALAAIRGFGLWLLAGALPGAVLIAVALGATGLARILTLVGAALLLGLGGGLALGAGVARRALRSLPANFFGICTGYAEEPSKRSGTPPLTAWLTDLIDRLAGVDGPAPLTFGDLWGTGDPDGERDINLEMVTTCLTQTRPYRLPFESRGFWFHPGEFRRLFPARVVDHMVAHARVEERDVDYGALVPLPEAADMPVVVAARMSLSFPVLISAIPLYAIDHAAPRTDQARRPSRCWFSDGGITSNFPVHFFDSPVPRWPTFAINLREFGYERKASPVQCENVWMPSDNRSGANPEWTSWEARSSAGQVGAFMGSIVRTMQNWIDGTQSQVHGYRDRIVHISRSKHEGGLNLSMDEHVIAALSERGGCAGDLLGRRFAVPPEDPSPLNWDNQRWIRYRSFMRLLEGSLRRLRRGYLEHAPEDRPLAEISARGHDEPPGYRWVSAPQRDQALAATDALIELIEQWDEQGHGFAAGAPSPAPELRVTPRI